MKRIPVLWRIVVIALILFGAIQLVPYGHNRSNPPVTGEPAWDSPQTRAYAKQACFDCHSNETIWPWYSYVAPASWLAVRDTEEGRSRLNFSEWGSDRRQAADEIFDVVKYGEMPPPQYTLIHSDARLQGDDLTRFLAGIEATFGTAK